MPGIHDRVFRVTSTEPRNKNFGTAFLVYHDDLFAYFVTCTHVIEMLGGPDHVAINTQRSLVEATKKWPDLTILRISLASLHGRVGDFPNMGLLSKAAREGLTFIVYGFKALDDSSCTKSSVEGHLLRREEVQGTNQIGTSKAWQLRVDSNDILQPGFSGSPVVDQGTGKVVGVITHGLSGGTEALALDISELWTVWAIPQELWARDRREKPRVQKGAFVGRKRQLDNLFTAARAVLDGDGKIVLIKGPAGIGKSVLLNHWKNRLVESFPQFVAAVGRSATGKSLEPFAMIFEQLLTSRVSRITAAGVTERPIDVIGRTIRSLGIGGLGPFGKFSGTATRELQTIVGQQTQGMQVTGDAEALHYWYSRVIFTLAESFPLFIGLDDIHRADDSSLSMLMGLGATPVSYQLMIGCTYRDEATEDRLGSLESVAVPPRGLTLNAAPDDTREFCYEYLLIHYGTSFTNAFVRLLDNLTGGNILFLSEILLYFEAERYIVQNQQKWTLKRLPDMLDAPATIERLKLPTTIESTFDARLRNLDPIVRKVLDWASVEGESFTAEVIFKGLQGDPSASEQVKHLAGLFDLIRTQLVHKDKLVREEAIRALPSEVTVHTFRFVHALFQRHLYNQVGLTRTEIHEKIGEALEQLWTGAHSEVAGRLAVHFSNASICSPKINDKTVKYALMAATLSAELSGWSEVTRLARQGLLALGSPRLETIDCYVQLRLLYAKGEFEGGIYTEKINHITAGIEALKSCLDWLDNVDRHTAADVYLTLGKLYDAQHIPDEHSGNEYRAKAKALYESLNDKAGIFESLSQSLDPNPANPGGGSLRFENRLRCLELAHELGTEKMVAKAYRDLAEHYITFETPEDRPLNQAEEYATKALEVAERLKDPREKIYSMITLSWAYHHQGRYGNFLQEYRENIRELARESKHTVLEAEARTDLAHFFSFLVYEQERAATELESAYKLKHGIGRHAVQDAEHYGQFLFRRGRFDESSRILEESIKGQDLYRSARTHGILARISLLTRNADEVESTGELRKIEGAIRAHPSLANVPNSHLMLAYAVTQNIPQVLAEIKKLSVPFGILEGAARRGLFHTYYDYPTDIAEAYRLLRAIREADEWSKISEGYWLELERTQTLSVVRTLVMYWEHRFVCAKILYDQQRHVESLRILDEVRINFEEAKHYSLAETLYFAGLIQLQLSHDDRAWEDIRRARDLANQYRLVRVRKNCEDLLARRESATQAKEAA
jgi:tetratricopeptide (TPR) repeat protein